MTMDEVRELIELVATKGFAEFEVERSGFRLRIVAHRGNTSVELAPPAPSEAAPARVAAPITPKPSSAPAAAAAAEPAPAAEPALEIVRSPIVGTFYRSPSPTSEAFVKIGDRVELGQVLCIVEAMKLMNEIESEVSGEIVKVFVENGQPVEYGQPLFGLRS